MTGTIFAVFGLAALFLFRLVEPSRAVAMTCLAGWLLLPVGNFPAGSAEAAFPYWITGAAVPSDMLLTKIWWPPVVALAGALWRDRPTLIGWRPEWRDGPVALFCLWPLAQGPFVAHPDPSPWVAALYLLAAWGTPWLLGRVYFCGQVGGVRLLTALTAGLAVIAPIAVLEGIMGPKVYGWFYEPHPFRLDGVARYIGYRPLGFFEDGNQYGIWVAATALAAIWLWRIAPANRMRRWAGPIAAAALVVALMSQSVGAILLLILGLVLLWGTGRPVTRWVLRVVFLITLLGGAIYLSSGLPLRTIAEHTVVGHEIVETLRSTGRGSILWRLARDQRAMSVIGDHPVLGTGRWDWWREAGQRPWDLATLLVGQFGLIGMILAFGSLLTPALGAFREKNLPVWKTSLPAVPLGIIVLMGVADMLLNSFVLYPAILAAGALVPVKELRNEAGADKMEEHHPLNQRGDR